MRCKIMENEKIKILRSDTYNYNFDKKTGMFVRWGKTPDDDPPFSPFGPEIADIEISINGCPNGCEMCYKGNTNTPATNMTYETFAKILDKMPKTLTQIAFGITGVKTNPDFLKIMQLSREKGVVPNFTLSGIDLDDDMVRPIADVVGALAVSCYQTDKNVCYNTVKKFVDAGLTQTNIHIVVSEESEDFVYEVLNDIKTDDRLKGLNAIVLLGIKPKGRARNNFHPLSLDKYSRLIEYCVENEIPIGFDSCSAQKFEAVVKIMDKPDDWKQKMLMVSESCESSLFSTYINVHGDMWHCSFSEEEDGIKKVNVLEADDFMNDVWYHPNTVEFRERVMATEKDGCRKCIVFKEVNV